MVVKLGVGSGLFGHLFRTSSPAVTIREVHGAPAIAAGLPAPSSTGFRLAYDFSRAESTYVYGLVPNSPLGPIGQLPPVLNRSHRLIVDGRYSLNQHLGAGLVYWVEKYDVDDFALATVTLNAVSLPALIALDVSPVSRQDALGARDAFLVMRGR